MGLKFLQKCRRPSFFVSYCRMYMRNGTIPMLLLTVKLPWLENNIKPEVQSEGKFFKRWHALPLSDQYVIAIIQQKKCLKPTLRKTFLQS